MGLSGRVDRHFFAVGLAAAEVCFHKALVLRKAAVNYRLVGALHAVHRHLLGKADVGGVVLCHHQQAAGVLINAVDDAGADLAANAGKAALAVPQQGVDQRAVRVAGCGVHHHALGLVDHQQMGILVDDIQRDILRHGLDGLCVRDLQQHGVSCLEFQAFGHSLAVALHMTLGHQRLQRRAGQAGVLAAEKAVDWLGESAQLKYPIQGELLSPFVLQDLDGDGQQDAAVLYTTAQTANVCIAILQRDDAGSWQVRQSVEGLAETVENVSLAQLQDTDSCQLVVGYTAAQNDHYLAVYSYQDGTLSTILEQQYEQYLVENITGGSSQDLILMSTQEDGSVQIELLTADREGSFRQVAVNGLSADKFSGCASVAAGAGADGRHYLVLDGWTGISGNNLASVLLCYDETSQQMVPATRISSQRLYNASLRNVPTLVSRDLDGDGIVEIPTQPDEAGLLNLSQSRRMDFIVWMDYTSSHPEKSFGLLDEETNCYIELPAEWEGNLKLTDSEEYDGAVELRTVDEDELVLTVRLARTSANSTGWTRLGVVASRQLQARMGPDVLLADTNYRLSKALYLLN